MKLPLASSMIFLAASCASVTSTPSSRLTVHGVEYVPVTSTFSAASTSKSRREIALKMIREQLGSDCAFEIEKILSDSIGTNGSSIQLLRVSTCQGEKFFEFDYWHPDFFPKLPGPYELKELAPRT